MHGINPVLFKKYFYICMYRHRHIWIKFGLFGKAQTQSKIIAIMLTMQTMDDDDEDANDDDEGV